MDNSITFPKGSHSFEVFAVKPRTESTHGMQAYIGYKLNNDGFHYVDVPFTDPEIIRMYRNASNGWRPISELPDIGRLLITWSEKTESYRVCKYVKALTWRGFKYKFVNVHSKGMWDEDATHWTYFPTPPTKSK